MRVGIGVEEELANNGGSNDREADSNSLVKICCLAAKSNMRLVAFHLAHTVEDPIVSRELS